MSSYLLPSTVLGWAGWDFLSFLFFFDFSFLFCCFPFIFFLILARSCIRFFSAFVNFFFFWFFFLPPSLFCVSFSFSSRLKSRGLSSLWHLKNSERTHINFIWQVPHLKVQLASAFTVTSPSSVVVSLVLHRHSVLLVSTSVHSSDGFSSWKMEVKFPHSSSVSAWCQTLEPLAGLPSTETNTSSKANSGWKGNMIFLVLWLCFQPTFIAVRQWVEQILVCVSGSLSDSLSGTVSSGRSRPSYSPAISHI